MLNVRTPAADGAQAVPLHDLIAVPALGLGVWLWVGYGIGWGPGNAWMHAKLAVVVLSIGYHHSCSVILRKFVAGGNTRSHIWYRWYNEAPVLMLLAAVLLVVLKPF
jgi:putative membrane protein